MVIPFIVESLLYFGSEFKLDCHARNDTSFLPYLQKRNLCPWAVYVISWLHYTSKPHRISICQQDFNVCPARPHHSEAVCLCWSLANARPASLVNFSAALEAEREVQIVEKLGQSSDHPILVTLPESEYLKGFVCRVI